MIEVGKRVKVIKAGEIGTVKEVRGDYFTEK